MRNLATKRNNRVQHRQSAEIIQGNYTAIMATYRHATTEKTHQVFAPSSTPQSQ
jgi:hypothetical protein